MKVGNSLAAALLGVLLVPVIHAAPVLNDTFTDAGRTAGADALDAAWYTISGAATTLTVVDDSAGIGSGNALRLGATAHSQGFVAQLPSTVTLVDGATLSLSFKWRFSGTSNINQSGRLRFGLYNSGGTPTVSDAHATIRNNDVGYAVSTNPGSASATGTALVGESSGSEILGGTGFDSLGVTGASISGGTTMHTAQLTIQRSGGSLIVTGQIDSAAAATTTVSSPLTYAFDSVAVSIGIGNYTTPSPLLVDDVVVDHAVTGGAVINLSTSHDFPVPGNITANGSTVLSSLSNVAAFQAAPSANRYVYSFSTWPETGDDLGLNEYAFRFDLDGDGGEDQRVKLYRVCGFTTPQLTKATSSTLFSSPSNALGGLGDIGWNGSTGSQQVFTFSKPVAAFGAVYRTSTGDYRLFKSTDYPVDYTLTDGTVVRLGAYGTEYILPFGTTSNPNQTYIGIQDTTGKGIVSVTFRFRGKLSGVSQHLYLDDMAFIDMPEPATSAIANLNGTRDFRNPGAISASASLAGLCTLQQFRDLASLNKHVYSFTTWPQAAANLGVSSFPFKFDLDGNGSEDQRVTVSYAGTYTGSTFLTRTTLTGASSPSSVLGGVGNVAGTAYAEHTFAFQKPVSAFGCVYNSAAGYKLQRSGGFPVSYTRADGVTVNLGTSGAVGATLNGNANSFVGLIDPSGKGISSVTFRVMGTAASNQNVYIDDLAFVLAGPPPGNWTLWFNEEFNGTALDPTIWSTGMRWGGSINNELQAYRPEYVTVANGVATIRADMTRGQINNVAGYLKGATVVNVDGFTAAIPNGTIIRIGTRVAGEKIPNETPTTNDDEVEFRTYTVASTVGGSTPTQITLTSPLRHDITDNTRVVLVKKIQSFGGQESGSYDYGSGAISTWNKWAGRYGYWEARIKMANGAGTWPAFWLMPDRGPEAVKNQDKRVAIGTATGTVTVPMGNELDITEFMSAWQVNGLFRSHSGHIWRYSTDTVPGLSSGDYALVKDGWGPEQYFYPNADTEFHTYGMLWRPNELVFYIDGRPVVRNTSGANVSAVPSYIILNTAIHTNQWLLNTTINAIDADLVTPRLMEIDYVKVWRDNNLPPETEYIYDNDWGANRETLPSSSVWTRNQNASDAFYGDYWYDGTKSSSKMVRWLPNFQVGGTYEVYLWWPYNSANSASVPVDVVHSGGTTTVNVNQQNQATSGQWYSIGSYTFGAGASGSVVIKTAGTSGRVVVDAVRFVKQ